MTRLFFDHIPRSGGSAFCRSLRAALGSGAVVTGALSGNLSSVLRRYAALPAICGALEYAPGDKLPDDRLSATLLREPLTRVLSWYSFERHDQLFAGPRLPLAAACRSLSLADCLDSGEAALLAHLANGQAKHFAALRHDGREVLDEGRLLELAIEALEAFAVVGVHESLPEFVDLASARLGWGLLPELERSRAASHPIDAASLDGDTLRRLQAANAVDTELVEYVRARFERERREAFRAMVAMLGPREPLRLALAANDAGGTAPAGAPAITDHAAEMAFVETPTSLGRDTLTAIEVEVRNASGELWPEGGERPVRLSYHWIGAGGAMAVYDGERTRLPYDLGPGDSVRMRAVVKTPEAPGRYRLRLGLVQEGVAWFETDGPVGPEIEVDVVSDAASAR